MPCTLSLIPCSFGASPPPFHMRLAGQEQGLMPSSSIFILSLPSTKARGGHSGSGSTASDEGKALVRVLLLLHHLQRITWKKNTHYFLVLSLVKVRNLFDSFMPTAWSGHRALGKGRVCEMYLVKSWENVMPSTLATWAKWPGFSNLFFRCFGDCGQSNQGGHSWALPWLSET